MRLLFEWIKCDENNIFNDCGVNFTSDYNITYDSQTHVLKISKEKSCVVREFYTLDKQNVVSQVSCFVGKNGSGKTSLLKHLYSTDLIRMDEDIKKGYTHWNTIQVYEFENIIKIYHNQEKIEVLSDLNYQIIANTFNNSRQTIDELFENGDYAKTTKIFLSNDYFVYVNSNMTNGGKQSKTAITPYDIRVFQDTFFRCITEKRESFYVWKNNLYVLNEYLKQGANAYHFQNILYLLFYRFINISKKENDFKYLKGMRITFQELSKNDAIGGIFESYRMLINKFSISQIIQSNISQENINNYAIHCGLKSVDNRLLLICAVFMLAQEKLTEKEKSIYTNLKLNLLTEILLSLHDFESIDICTLDSYEIKGVLSLLEKSIETEDYQSGIRKPLKEIKVDELKYLTNANESIENLRNAISNTDKMEYIDIDSNLKILDIIDEEVKLKKSFILKYIWLNYRCSAGERAYLNTFSWLSSISYLQYFSDNAVDGINKKVLLLIDEPDLYCHPEWQRKMLKNLIDTLELLYKGHSVHLIFATHSPLFLSDIPNNHIWKIDRNKEGYTEICPMETKTFAANIYDLYNDCFYLDSYIGEFAQEKIGKAIRKIYKWYENKDSKISKKDFDNANYIVDLIGEPLLQHKLLDMLKTIQKRVLW